MSKEQKKLEESLAEIEFTQSDLTAVSGHDRKVRHCHLSSMGLFKVSEVLADRCYLIPDVIDKERYLSKTPVKPVLPIEKE